MELNRQIVRFEEQVKTGTASAEGNIRFADFAQQYMTNYGDLNLKPTTLANYKRNLVRINQAIGHIRLKDLTILHIQTFYRNLQKQGVRQHITAAATPALKEWFSQQHISQYALAKKAGITHQTVNQASMGRPISEESAAKVSAAIGMEIKVLFTVTNDATPLARLQFVHTTTPFPPS